jgi:hypothetical protein
MCVDTGFAIDRLETWGTRLFAECQAVQPPVKHTLGYGTFLDIR